jgi:hypothetical protein
MPLNIPPSFDKDIQGRDTNIFPIVRINTDTTIRISTNSVNHNGYYYKPLLLNIPSIKEKINISTRKYTISNVNLDISNTPYEGGKTFSEIVGENSLINTDVEIRWLSPSSIDDESFQIYNGTVRKYDIASDGKVRILLEDRSQAALDKDLPQTTLFGAGVPDKYQNKKVPLVVGKVDKSPCVLSSPLTTGDDAYSEEQVVIQVDSIPVDLTDGRLYIYDEYYYKIAKYQNYSLFGLHLHYQEGDVYTHQNIDNKIILTLSQYMAGDIQEYKITSFAQDNAHVEIEPKIQTVSGSMWHSDDLILDNGNFIEGTGISTDVSIYNADSFIEGNGILYVDGTIFYIADGSYRQLIQALNLNFTIKPIPSNIISSGNITVDGDNIEFNPIRMSINPTGIVQAEKQFGTYYGADGHNYGTITTYNNGFWIYLLLQPTIWGEFEFQHPTSSDTENFAIQNVLQGETLTQSQSSILNNFTISFSPDGLSGSQVIDLTGYASNGISLNSLNIKYDIMAKDVFKNPFYVNVKGRAMASDGTSPTAPAAIKHILNTELGQNVYTTFSDNYGWGYDFTVDKKISGMKLIQNIASASPYIPRYDPMGSFDLIEIPMGDVYSDHIIKEEDVIDFSFSRSSISDVKTRIIFNYRWDYARGAFDADPIDINILEILPLYDPNYYGFKMPDDGEYDHAESTLEISDHRGKYIRDYATAKAFAEWFLMWSCNSHLQLNIKLPLKWLKLEVGDFVSFDALLGGISPYEIDYYQQLTDDKVNAQKVFKNFLITSTNKTLTGVQISCVQMHDLDPSWVYGCTNVDACNYDPDANIDNGICTFLDACGDCVPAGNTDCNIDCTGVEGGDALVDECGVCEGEGVPAGDCDCFGNVLDECGECGGYGIDDLCSDSLFPCTGGETGLVENQGCAGCQDEDAINDNFNNYEKDVWHERTVPNMPTEAGQYSMIGVDDYFEFIIEFPSFDGLIAYDEDDNKVFEIMTEPPYTNPNDWGTTVQYAITEEHTYDIRFSENIQTFLFRKDESDAIYDCRKLGYATENGCCAYEGSCLPRIDNIHIQSVNNLQSEIRFHNAAEYAVCNPLMIPVVAPSWADLIAMGSEESYDGYYKLEDISLTVKKEFLDGEHWGTIAVFITADNPEHYEILPNQENIIFIASVVPKDPLGNDSTESEITFKLSDFTNVKYFGSDSNDGVQNLFKIKEGVEPEDISQLNIEIYAEIHVADSPTVHDYADIPIHPYYGTVNVGDVNGDGAWNVLDIVALANCVLADGCGEIIHGGASADVNGDGGWNVLDIVALANCVLADSCGDE